MAHLKDNIPFKPSLTEDIKPASGDAGGGRLRVTGRFQHADMQNENRRIYPRSVLESNLQPDSRFMQSVRERAVFGHLEHPADGQSDLAKAAIIITEVKMTESGEVIGTLETLDTPSGRIAKALFEAGMQVGISSRGHGSVMPDSSGIDLVQEDFELETFDLVADPSTPGARLVAERLQSEGKATLQESLGAVSAAKLAENNRAVNSFLSHADNKSWKLAYRVSVGGSADVCAALTEAVSSFPFGASCLYKADESVEYSLSARSYDELIERLTRSCESLSGKNSDHHTLLALIGGRDVDGIFFGADLREADQACPEEAFRSLIESGRGPSRRAFTQAIKSFKGKVQSESSDLFEAQAKRSSKLVESAFGKIAVVRSGPDTARLILSEGKIPKSLSEAFEFLVSDDLAASIRGYDRVVVSLPRTPMGMVESAGVSAVQDLFHQVCERHGFLRYRHTSSFGGTELVLERGSGKASLLSECSSALSRLGSRFSRGRFAEHLIGRMCVEDRMPTRDMLLDLDRMAIGFLPVADLSESLVSAYGIRSGRLAWSLVSEALEDEHREDSNIDPDETLMSGMDLIFTNAEDAKKFAEYLEQNTEWCAALGVNQNTLHIDVARALLGTNVYQEIQTAVDGLNLAGARVMEPKVTMIPKKDLKAESVEVGAKQGPQISISGPVDEINSVVRDLYNQYAREIHSSNIRMGSTAEEVTAVVTFYPNVEHDEAVEIVNSVSGAESEYLPEVPPVDDDDWDYDDFGDDFEFDDDDGGDDQGFVPDDEEPSDKPDDMDEPDDDDDSGDEEEELEDSKYESVNESKVKIGSAANQCVVQFSHPALAKALLEAHRNVPDKDIQRISVDGSSAIIEAAYGKNVQAISKDFVEVVGLSDQATILE